jgi:hypothetical protein
MTAGKLLAALPMLAVLVLATVGFLAVLSLTTWKVRHQKMRSMRRLLADHIPGPPAGPSPRHSHPSDPRP